MRELFYLRFAILACVLIFASHSDIRRHEVPNRVPVMIAMTGLIDVTPAQIVIRLCTALLLIVPLVIASMLRKNGLGGADIKMLAAGVFVLGPRKGVLALGIGCLLAVLVYIVVRIRKQTWRDPFAFIPYISAGLAAAYFL